MITVPKAGGVPSWVPFFNPVARLLLRVGVPMGPDVLITVPGRKTGLPRTTPVTICEHAGRRGLISRPVFELHPLGTSAGAAPARLSG